MYWIIGRKSQLSLENKLLMYKAILKPIWTYGLQLWVAASNSNIEIVEGFQSKVLRIITDAPRYVPNAVIKRDLRVLSVRHQVRNYSVTYLQCATAVSPTVSAQLQCHLPPVRNCSVTYRQCATAVSHAVSGQLQCHRSSVRNYSVTWRRRLDDHPNRPANILYNNNIFWLQLGRHPVAVVI
jgi:hypothetical protein